LVVVVVVEPLQELLQSMTYFFRKQPSNHFNFQRKKYEYNIIEVLFFQGKSLDRLASGNSKFSKLRNFQAYE
jgi:hypothetical protein